MSFNRNKKAAIFDIDEVLLDMLSPMHRMYETFCGRDISDDEFTWHMRNFNKEPERYKDFGVFFNSSPVYLNLPAKRGMLPILAYLKAHDFDIHLISASSNDRELERLRKENVCRHYGEIFSSVNCIGNQNKRSAIRALAECYDTSFYCDDTPQVVNQSVGITDFSIWLFNPLYEIYAPLLDEDKTQVAYKPQDILQIINSCKDNPQPSKAPVSASDIKHFLTREKVNNR